MSPEVCAPDPAQHEMFSLLELMALGVSERRAHGVCRQFGFETESRPRGAASDTARGTGMGTAQLGLRLR